MDWVRGKYTYFYVYFPRNNLFNGQRIHFFPDFLTLLDRNSKKQSKSMCVFILRGYYPFENHYPSVEEAELISPGKNRGICHEAFFISRLSSTAVLHFLRIYWALKWLLLQDHKIQDKIETPTFSTVYRHLHISSWRKCLLVSVKSWTRLNNLTTVSSLPTSNRDIFWRAEWPWRLNPGVTLKIKIKLLTRDVLFIPADISTNVFVCVCVSDVWVWEINGATLGWSNS